MMYMYFVVTCFCAGETIMKLAAEGFFSKSHTILYSARSVDSDSKTHHPAIH